MEDVVMTKQIYLAVRQADVTVPPLAVLSAEAEIPLWWLSLFELTDFSAAATLQLSCPLQLAQQRWRRRLPALLQWLGPASASLLDSFSCWLAAQRGQLLQLLLTHFDSEAACWAALQQYFADLQQIEQTPNSWQTGQSAWLLPVEPAHWWKLIAGDANVGCDRTTTAAIPTAGKLAEVRELIHPHTLEITAAVVPLAPELPETLPARLQQQLRLYPNLTPFLYLGAVSQPLGQALQQRLLAGPLDPLLADVLMLALDHHLMSARHYQALQFTATVDLPLVAALTADGRSVAQFNCAAWPVEQLDLMLTALRQWLQLRLPE